MYPFMTLNDNTEITYSSPLQTSEIEMDRLKELVKSVAHILLRLSKEGGVESA